jgi:hypothetical protein
VSKAASPTSADLPRKLARFIFSQRQYSIQKLRPKPSAFLPPPDLQTSAFGIDGSDEGGIRWIADNVVAKESQRQPPPARADISFEAVLAAQLAIVPDPAIHPRHVNICGWPAEKEKQLAAAQDLCVEATLKIR